MLKYAAYQGGNDGKDFSFTGRDESAGIFGTYINRGTSPIAIADTLEELRYRGLAHLGKEPSMTLYLTDADGRVYGWLLNKKYHESLDRVRNRFAIAIVLLIFCITGL